MKRILSKNKKSYGALESQDEIFRADYASDSESVFSSSSSSGASGFTSSWKGTRKSVMAQAQIEAKLMGAKRSLPTPILSASSLVSVKPNDEKWSWPRKIKVAILTFVCLTVTGLLLFFPEEVVRKRIVEVDRRSPVQLEIDTSYGSSISEVLKVFFTLKPVLMLVFRSMMVCFYYLSAALWFPRS